MVIERITILDKRSARLQSGHPWIFSNEIRMTSREKTMQPGSIVHVMTEKDQYLATAYFNPHSLIAARVLTRDPNTTIDASFFEFRLRAALGIRDNLFARPFYRLVHAEGDMLPGLIIDRFGDVFSLQANTAGMDARLPNIVQALQNLFQPRAIVAHHESGARAQEGLPQETKILHGDLSTPLILVENNTQFSIDIVAGQKTGWFYDHRANRAFVAKLARGKTMLEGYCYAGSFTIQAAIAGAKSVIALDRSDGAVQSAKTSALLNNVETICDFHKADVFETLENFKTERRTFDVVAMDPPAFIKSKKDHAAGLKGYQKLSKLASFCVAPGGYLFIASCSHHAKIDEFMQAVTDGIRQAGRSARLIRSFGADVDHPVHPQLPETSYLKSLTFYLE